MDGGAEDNPEQSRESGRHAAADQRRPFRPATLARRRAGAHAAENRLLDQQRLRGAVALEDDDLHIFGRSAKVWGAWVAAIAFVASAAFGGLKSAAPPAPAPVRPGHAIDAGQFHITLRHAVARIEGAGSFRTSQFRIDATITLGDDRGTTDARSDIVKLSGFPGLKVRPTLTADPRDDSTVTLIPGTAVPVAYGWDLPKKPHIPHQVTVQISDLRYLHSGPVTGYEEWLVNNPVAKVTLPVMVTKVAR